MLSDSFIWFIERLGDDSQMLKSHRKQGKLHT